MDHFATLSDADGQIEAGVGFASEALTSWLTTESMHGDEAATEKELIVEQFGKARSGDTFKAGKMAPNSHGNHLPLFCHINIYQNNSPMSIFSSNANLLLYLIGLLTD